MTKIIRVGSYAEAESMGIKPVDSIISVSGESTYFKYKKEPPYTIVGYGQGYTFIRDEVVFVPNMKSYIAFFEDEDFEYHVYAINKALAERIVKDSYKGKFVLKEKILR